MGDEERGAPEGGEVVPAAGRTPWTGFESVIVVVFCSPAHVGSPKADPSRR